MFTVFMIASTISAIATITGTLITIGKGVSLVSAINQIRDMLDIANLDVFKSFDQMQIDITGKAITMLVYCMEYAKLFVQVGALLMIIFYCFKLWSGTIELKKFYVETVFKCLIVTFLVNFYPTITLKTYDFATELGVKASGGQNTVMQSFASLADRVKGLWEQGGYEEVFNYLREGNLGGQINISDKVITQFTKNGLTREQAEQWAKNKGFTVVSDDFLSKQEQKKMNKAAEMVKKNKKTEKKFMQQSMAILEELNNLLTDVTEDEVQGNTSSSVTAVDLLTKGSAALENVFYNPYVPNTNRLSFSTMMKTALIMAKITEAGSLASLEQKDKEKTYSWDDMSKAKDPRLITKFIGRILSSKLVYELGMLIAVMFIMLEYIITLIEYLIVIAVSSLLIPLYFLDATKQYVTNIIKTVLTFMLKLLITTMMCFFVISCYIHLGEIMLQKDLSSTLCILLYASTLIMGLLLAKNCGRLASAVISGNPSLGMGEVAREFHQGMRMSSMAMHGFERTLGQISKTAGSAASGAAKFDVSEKAASANSANIEKATKSELEKRRGDVQALQSRFENGEQLSSEEMQELQAGQGLLNMSDSDIKTAAHKAGKSAKRNQMFRMVKDWGYSKFSGFDNNVENYGALRVGQMFKDKQNNVRQATAADVREYSNKNNQQYVDNALEKASKKHGRNQDADFDQKELDAKFKQNWPSQDL